ncbi:uncharacterized protein LOC121385236 [Gigantopelta aegis]|uniref:uncharacterized protein LOC121385236 n=1 Tax=Gigantopelta aegis TaxID=1735272 RepID=UPI001B88938B|nr:uncharacterized protein LOC121385236 [Gigantopelta aegis]
MSVSRYPAGYLTDSHGEAWSETGSEIEMHRYPSQPSMGGTSFISGTSRSYISGSRKSVYSTYTTTYTPSQISYVLPVVANAPNPLKKPKDNFGFAFCSLFFNPIFGLVALLLAEQSKVHYNHCNYIEASKYGSYAKGVAASGIISMLVLLVLIIALVLWHNYRFAY